ncbi:hypothetical protein C0993_010678 [Termitomyces sp. T159_Od127]|nr:hypothetical protein C0993_010678 [Termitomyces sp. T159_Od127]
MTLLHPGVTTWYVEYATDWPNFQVPIPVQRLFGLVSLEIGNDVTRDDLTGLSTLYELPHLATLVLYRYTVTYSVLEVLSRFPALRVIRTHVAPCTIPDCGAHRPPPPPIKDGSFRMLTVLTISGCPHQISEILDDENFPSHIESLIVESIECTEDPSPSPVFPQIVEKIPTLTEFELREMIRDVSSPFASLKPFLSYKLTELRVESYLALAYSASEIEELVRSLPIIEVLYLDPGTLSSHASFGTFQLNHLPLFARHCPRLAYLGIRLDTSYPCDTSLHDIAPFSVLEELDLGVSFGSSSVSCGAAALLAFLLPQYCQLTFQYPYHSPLDAMLFKFVKDFVGKKPVRALSLLLDRTP